MRATCACGATIVSQNGEEHWYRWEPPYGEQLAIGRCPLGGLHKPAGDIIHTCKIRDPYCPGCVAGLEPASVWTPQA